MTLQVQHVGRLMAAGESLVGAGETMKVWMFLQASPVHRPPHTPGGVQVGEQRFADQVDFRI